MVGPEDGTSGIVLGVGGEDGERWKMFTPPPQSGEKVTRRWVQKWDEMGPARPVEFGLLGGSLLRIGCKSSSACCDSHGDLNTPWGWYRKTAGPILVGTRVIVIVGGAGRCFQGEAALGVVFCDIEHLVGFVGEENKRLVWGCAKSTIIVAGVGRSCDVSSKDLGDLC